jgi:hypothetical protein
MMEDGEEEENDDNYPMFPEYGDTAVEIVKKKEVMNGHQLSLLMILVGSFLMQIETAKKKEVAVRVDVT